MEKEYKYKCNSCGAVKYSENPNDYIICNTLHYDENGSIVCYSECNRTATKLNDIEDTRVKESGFTIESLIDRSQLALGQINNIGNIDKDVVDALLCLAKEVKQLRAELKTLKQTIE